MSSDVVVSVRGLGKRYTLTHDEPPTTLIESLLARARDPFRRRGREQFWALRDADLDVREGEIVGIIGRNGAGKSTLLKILSRITPPTEGQAELRGSVGSLLEVGTGFHRELTGRENIYLNGGLLGMSRLEISRRFDEIVEFSGTEKFLDTPVKRYSSGMYVRLAFAVAAHLQPDILIIDEVLSVGDAEFQGKCLGKMQDVARNGRTVLFVSHNIAAVQSLCHRCIWIDAGRIRSEGDVKAVTGEYLGSVVTTEPEVDLVNHHGRGSSEHAVLRHVRLLNERGDVSAAIPIGETLRIQFLISPREVLRQPLIGIGVSNVSGHRLFTVHTRYSQSELRAINEPTWIECEIPNITLMPGKYILRLSVGVHGRDLDAIENAASFEVLPADYFATGALPTASQGIIVQESRWRTVTVELAEAM